MDSIKVQIIFESRLLYIGYCTVLQFVPYMRKAEFWQDLVTYCQNENSKTFTFKFHLNMWKNFLFRLLISIFHGLIFTALCYVLLYMHNAAFWQYFVYWQFIQSFLYLPPKDVQKGLQSNELSYFLLQNMYIVHSL